MIPESPFQGSGWYRAITIEERIASLPATTEAAVQLDADAAQGRKREWRQQPPFLDDPLFAQRLAADGITEADFDRLVSEPVQSVRERLPVLPSWLADLAQAFSRPPSSETIPLPEPIRSQPLAGLLNSVQPLLLQGIDRLRRGIAELIAKHPNAPFDPGTVEEMLFDPLPGQLIRMLSRTLALEVNVMRVQGLLEGETAEDRFHNFTERLRQPEHAIAIWQEYPVLARQVVSRLRQWVECSLEFLERLCTDWESLRRQFSLEEDPGLLVQLEGEAGDGHGGGRSVLMARFRSGLRLVYKPRPLGLAERFQELLSWINKHGNPVPFRTAKIADCGTHGWMEFIAASPCSSRQEVERFYHRQGGYLALLYALEATDFHLENVIAAGEHPVLIDLESLFHPREEAPQSQPEDDPGDRAIRNSVIRVGLLPYRTPYDTETEHLDVSGLGGAPGQMTPYAIPQWENAATDQMYLERRPVALEGSQNRPSLQGADVDLLDYTDTIVTGFRSIYRLLMENRAQLLGSSGLVARFSQDEIRVILRMTRTYYFLLEESFHPDLLRDGLDRDRHFDRLWMAVEEFPHLAKVIRAERRDLYNGDIPFFTAKPGSPDLWSSSQERIGGFFPESGLAAVERRIQQLDEHDLELQIWMIRASLAAMAAEPDRQSPPARARIEAQASAAHADFLAEACAIGDRLETMALHGRHNVAWLGLTMADERSWSVLPLDVDLYDGLPGVALFLAYLGAISGEERYTALSQAACATMRQTVEANRPLLVWIGGFTGWGGILYALTHLGTLWGQPALLDEAEEITGRLPPLIEQDQRFDVIAGAAGCIGALLSLHERRPARQTLCAAIQCGDRLIAAAEPAGEGLCWRIPGMGPLAGFSHGAAGIAWALLKLFGQTLEERFRTAALGGIDYERTLFSQEAANWRDLRDTEQVRFTTAWCHGAPGIGLARLSSLLHLDDSGIRGEIGTALKTTIADGFGRNHSLCHGDLGNFELVRHGAEALADPFWTEQANSAAAAILGSARQQDWRCGTPMGVESPGLMTGLAGIGYGLLRLAEPARVPCVLTLQAPPSIGARPLG